MEFDKKPDRCVDHYISEDYHTPPMREGAYLRVDWYAVDPAPWEAWVETDLGPNPKSVVLLDDPEQTQCVRTDISLFGIN